MAKPDFLAAVTFLAMTSSSLGLRVIDLTYMLKVGEDGGGPVHPRYNFSVVQRGYLKLVDGWAEFNQFSMGEHRGTHMDAPAHFFEGHWRMHQVPPHRLVGPGVVIDVTDKVKGNVDYAVTLQDIQDFESVYGKIPNGAVVLMRSGWGSRYPDKKRVYNSQTPDNMSTHHYPGFSVQAAKFLAEKRVIIALGGDSPSPDPGATRDFAVHKTMLADAILLLENVANVDRLPPVGTTIVLGALNIYDGSGAPMRVLALVDLNCGTWGTGGAMSSRSSSVFSLALASLIFSALLKIVG